MCQVFGVSRSGYYNWVQHEPSDRKQSDERLKLEIKVAHIRTRRNIWNPAAPDGAGREWHHRWS
ncbi:putative transposase [Shigella boydii 3594-74]|nr:putative transposase [Shigella boydii 3594-74]